MISFDADFDSGALNVSRTKHEGRTIVLEPRRFQGEWEKGDYGWLYFKMTGNIVARELIFQLPVEGSFSEFHEDQRFVFSYDLKKWHFFDNGEFNSESYLFSHNSPFSSNEVFIACGIPYTFKMIEEHTTSIRQSQWVLPTRSSTDDLTVGSTAGTINGGYRDDQGRDIPALKLFGYSIADPSGNKSKKKVVLAGGNHPGETIANYVLEGMVNFLISDHPAASTLRKNADFFVYPCTNPEGRYAGYFRSNPEHPKLDHNRHWLDSEGFTDTTLIQRAMKNDTGGSTDYFIDFHGQMKALRFEVWVLEELAADPFVLALQKRVPDLFVRKRPGSTTGCRTWSMSSEGLNSAFSFTPETPFLPNAFPEDYKALGKQYGLALSDVLSTAST